MSLPERCLSIRQPWAWAIVEGHKTVENRSWATSYRGRFAVHASLKPDPAGYAFLRSLGIEPPEDLPRGAIVGSVELVDVVDGARDRWAMPGQMHWRLARPRKLRRPIPMGGKLGLFRLDK